MPSSSSWAGSSMSGNSSSYFSVVDVVVEVLLGRSGFGGLVGRGEVGRLLDSVAGFSGRCVFLVVD